MDANEQWYIDRLTDTTVSEADHYSCIEVLEVLLSLDALPVLAQVLSDGRRSHAVRRRAAVAIHNLGASSVRNDLIQLSESGDAITREFARVALTKGVIAQSDDHA